MARFGSRRAVRRHHAVRVRSRARDVVKGVWRVSEEDVDRVVVRVADHLAKCSCFMCGHARRYEGVTPQERRADLGLEDHEG